MGGGGFCGLAEAGADSLAPCVAVHHLLLATACHSANYSALIQKHCLTRFQEDMEIIGQHLWCDWDKTVR